MKYHHKITHFIPYLQLKSEPETPRPLQPDVSGQEKRKIRIPFTCGSVSLSRRNRSPILSWNRLPRVRRDKESYRSAGIRRLHSDNAATRIDFKNHDTSHHSFSKFIGACTFSRILLCDRIVSFLTAEIFYGQSEPNISGCIGDLRSLNALHRYSGTFYRFLVGSDHLK